MPTKPNVIVFMTDDQGYGDLSCMGAPDFKTPTLDRLASDGARFTDWYSNSPVCSPSRAALLTGRYPGNAGVRSILQGHRTATGLPPSTPTLATHLRNNGYQTSMSGKWHLGMSEESRPHNHGFDHWYGFLAGCIDFYSHIFYWGPRNQDPVRNPTHDLWEDNEEVWQNGEYFTSAIKDRAVREIRRMASDKKPFFMYVPFNAPHYPMHAPQEYMDRFAHLPWDRRVMAAMISAVDDAIGEIMDEVTRVGEAENTLTFFVSDNGPSRESRNWLDGTMDPYYGGTAGGLKGHKFSLFEGGVRVPGIAHWPGKIAPGQVLNTPSASMDIVPTVLEAAGISTEDMEFDGTSLLPHLTANADVPERPIFWEMNGQTAVRRGNWKLVLDGQLVEESEPIAGPWLSNLLTDPAEETNLAHTNPEICRELEALARDWRAGIESRWEREFASTNHGTVSHSMV